MSRPTSLRDVANYLVVRCQRCGDPMEILLASRSHPRYCPECAALLADYGVADVDALALPPPAPERR
jgi:hypothetical protein